MVRRRILGDMDRRIQFNCGAKAVGYSGPGYGPEHRRAGFPFRQKSRTGLRGTGKPASDRDAALRISIRRRYASDYHPSIAYPGKEWAANHRVQNQESKIIG